MTRKTVVILLILSASGALLLPADGQAVEMRVGGIHPGAALNRNVIVHQGVRTRAGWLHPDHWWRPRGAIAPAVAIGFVGAAMASDWAGPAPGPAIAGITPILPTGMDSGTNVREQGRRSRLHRARPQQTLVLACWRASKCSAWSSLQRGQVSMSSAARGSLGAGTGATASLALPATPKPASYPAVLRLMTGSTYGLPVRQQPCS